MNTRTAIAAISLCASCLAPLWLTGCGSSATSPGADASPSDGSHPMDARPRDGAATRDGARRDAPGPGDAAPDVPRDAAIDRGQEAQADGTVDARAEAGHEAGDEAGQDVVVIVDAPADRRADVHDARPVKEVGSDAQTCAAATCSPGTCCGTECVDTSTDPNNCGGCWTSCGSGSVCDQGACVLPACSGANSNGEACIVSAGVHGSCCGGSCQPFSILNDPSDCGGCGVVCPTGSACVQAECELPDGGWPTCQADAGCPAGDVCVWSEHCFSPTCSAGSDGVACGIPASSAQGMCCSQACLDVDTDDDNCGTCGHVCGAGTFCEDGGCTAIPKCAVSPGSACPVSPGVVGECCEGSCVNLSTDPDDCGQCGARCPTGESCSNGGCSGPDGGAEWCTGPGDCPSGTLCVGEKCVVEKCMLLDTGSICAFGPSTPGTCCAGSCVNLTTDPEHCGACADHCASGVCGGSLGMSQCLPDGTTCVGGCPYGNACAKGTCVPEVCQGPMGLCLASDGQAGVCCLLSGWSASCTDVANDAKNCGGCGYVCPGGQTCSKGVCSGTVAPCGAGKVGAFCDLDAGTSMLCCSGTGCVDVSTDSDNCGACGNVCGAGMTCAFGGVCAALTCTGTTGYEPCPLGDGGSALGTCCGTSCVDFSTDPSSCGSCGHICPTVETCVGGSCGVGACTAATPGDPCHLEAGVGLCCPSGCLDTTSDPKNCGGCGAACPAGDTCVDSACK